MLVSEIGYLSSVNNAVVAEAVNKNQNIRSASLEGFGNYDKKNIYTFNKVNVFEYMKNSFVSLFSNKQTSADNSKKLSIIV